jgi:hypothetical protein
MQDNYTKPVTKGIIASMYFYAVCFFSLAVLFGVFNVVLNSAFDTVEDKSNSSLFMLGSYGSDSMDRDKESFRSECSYMTFGSSSEESKKTEQECIDKKFNEYQSTLDSKKASAKKALDKEKGRTYRTSTILAIGSVIALISHIAIFTDLFTKNK